MHSASVSIRVWGIVYLYLGLPEPPADKRKMLHTFFLLLPSEEPDGGPTIDRKMQQSSTTKWLLDMQHFDLTTETGQEMAGFLLLWALFERNRFGGNLGGRALDKIKSTAPNQANDYSQLLEEIEKRYIKGKPADYLFKKFPKMYQSFRSWFEGYLAKVQHSIEEEKTFVFSIMYQYRCNIMHGDKDLGTASKRQEKIIKAFNQYLRSCLV